MTGNNFPKVVILGSPNVGKSTLFNRLLGKRRSITDTTPGVTRDPIESVCTIQDVSFLLVDSGGYQAESTEGAEEAEAAEIGNSPSSPEMPEAREPDNSPEKTEQSQNSEEPGQRSDQNITR